MTEQTEALLLAAQTEGNMLVWFLVLFTSHSELLQWNLRIDTIIHRTDWSASWPGLSPPLPPVCFFLPAALLRLGWAAKLVAGALPADPTTVRTTGRRGGRSEINRGSASPARPAHHKTAAAKQAGSQTAMILK